MSDLIIEPGDEWFGAFCVNPSCGMPILWFQVTADMLEEEGAFRFEGEPPQLTCPYCQTAHVYSIGQLQLFQGREKGRLS